MKKSFFASLLSSVSLVFFLSLQVNPARSAAPPREYYEIRIYHLNSTSQQSSIDRYLQQALIPGLHRAGIGKVGVFKPVGIDTSSSPKIFVLIPYASLASMEKTGAALSKDKTFNSASADFAGASFDAPPYKRMEKIILQAFRDMPVSQAPKLSAPRTESVYELRSYEGPTENLYKSKVKMFNEGGEIGLFSRLGFNAVFYGEVLAGSLMPNLMYMTCFESMGSRDAHWKQFGEDPQWKTLSALSEYQHTVSHSDIFLLRATPYSDF